MELAITLWVTSSFIVSFILGIAFHREIFMRNESYRKKLNREANESETCYSKKRGA